MERQLQREMNGEGNCKGGLGVIDIHTQNGEARITWKNCENWREGGRVVGVMGSGSKNER